jgi:hypothetical protein
MKTQTFDTIYAEAPGRDMLMILLDTVKILFYVRKENSNNNILEVF